MGRYTNKNPQYINLWASKGNSDLLPGQLYTGKNLIDATFFPHLPSINYVAQIYEIERGVCTWPEGDC